MSNLKKMPGTACSWTVWDEDVTAYWLVKIVLRGALEEGERVKMVGTSER